MRVIYKHRTQRAQARKVLLLASLGESSSCDATSTLFPATWGSWRRVPLSVSGWGDLCPEVPDVPRLMMSLQELQIIEQV